MKHGSLFTGIGGFELGFGDAGFDNAWHAEVDRFCNRVLAARFPETPNHGNVEEINGRKLEPVDVVSFGSPCQDLSVAGRRAGLDGARSGLFFEAARIINQCRPAFAVWENVPGAFSSDGGRDFAMVLYTLRELGAHDVAWRVFDSQYAGVPQQRTRIYLVADFRGQRAGEILFESEGCGGHPSPFDQTREGVARSLTRGSSSAGVNEPGRRAEDDVVVENPTVARPLGSPTGGFRYDLDHDTYVIQERAVSENPESGPDGKGFRQGPTYTLEARSQGQYVAALARPVLAREGKGVDSSVTNGNIIVIQDATLDTLATQAVAFEPRHFTRGKAGPPSTPEPALTADADRGDGQAVVFQPRVAHTLKGSSEGSGIDNSAESASNLVVSPAQHVFSSHPDIADPLSANEGKTYTHEGSGNFRLHNVTSTIRRFTPLECERLQAFPDGWTCLCGVDWSIDPAAAMFICKCPDGPRYRALGNAVTTNVPRWIAQRMAKYFR